MVRNERTSADARRLDIIRTLVDYGLSCKLASKLSIEIVLGMTRVRWYETSALKMAVSWCGDCPEIADFLFELGLGADLVRKGHTKCVLEFFTLTKILPECESAMRTLQWSLAKCRQNNGTDCQHLHEIVLNYALSIAFWRLKTLSDVRIVFEVLFDAGADLRAERKSDGSNALDVLLQAITDLRSSLGAYPERSGKWSRERRDELPAFLDWLVRRGIRLTHSPPLAPTIAHLAVLLDDVHLLRLRLRHGGDVRQRRLIEGRKYCISPLELAYERRSIILFEELLQCGVPCSDEMKRSFYQSTDATNRRQQKGMPCFFKEHSPKHFAVNFPPSLQCLAARAIVKHKVKYDKLPVGVVDHCRAHSDAMKRER